MSAESSQIISIEPACLVSSSNKQSNPELNLVKPFNNQHSKNKNKTINDYNQNSPSNLTSINSPKNKQEKSANLNQYSSKKQPTSSKIDTHKKNIKVINQQSEPNKDSIKGYESLTLKLETALHKISSTKSGMSKTAGQSIINLFENDSEKKKRDITLIEQQQKKQFQQKPTINKNSQKIAKQMGHKPIFERLQIVLQQKNTKLKQLQELKKKQLQKEEQEFLQEYKKHAKRPETLRSYEQYFDQMVKWKQRKMTENQQKYNLNKSKELDGLTFKPILNSKSLKMVSMHERKPIQTRDLLKKYNPANKTVAGTFKKIKLTQQS